MLARVLDNLRPSCPHHITVVCLEDQKEDFLGLGIDNIVTVPEVTGGAAITARYGVGSNPNMFGPILVANSDQLLDWDVDDFLKNAEGAAAQVALFKAPDRSPKWSYALVQGHSIKRIVEKQPISDDATCGVYLWRDMETFRYATDCLIKNEDRHNGEFYLAPSMNYVSYVRAYWVNKMIGLGTPEDLEAYLA